MGKHIIIFILPVLLFVLNAHCETTDSDQNCPLQQISEDELSFETCECYNHNEGDIPAHQFFFNIFPKTTNSYSSNEKIKGINPGYFRTKTNTNFKHSFDQAQVFSSHSSVLVQLYLKTACFRL